MLHRRQRALIDQAYASENVVTEEKARSRRGDPGESTKLLQVKKLHFEEDMDILLFPGEEHSEGLVQPRHSLGVFRREEKLSPSGGKGRNEEAIEMKRLRQEKEVHEALKKIETDAASNKISGSLMAIANKNGY